MNRVSVPFAFCKARVTRCPGGTARINVRKPQARRAVGHARRVAALARRDPGLGIDMAPVGASLEGYLARGDADLSWLARRAGAREWKV